MTEGMVPIVECKDYSRVKTYDYTANVRKLPSEKIPMWRNGSQLKFNFAE
jgi:hypothetical protein